MQKVNIENQIMSRIKDMDPVEKAEILDYITMRGPKRHSTRAYKRKALRQIREALDPVK